MSFKCKIGLHSWNGCKCSKCGKTRDEQHNWSKDCKKCSNCGKTRENQHDWKGCKCSKCGITRDEQHNWSKDCDNCSICGKRRYDAHDWDGCICKNCNRLKIYNSSYRDLNKDHNWNYESAVCNVCGAKMRASTEEYNCNCILDLDYFFGMYKNKLPLFYPLKITNKLSSLINELSYSEETKIREGANIESLYNLIINFVIKLSDDERNQVYKFLKFVSLVWIYNTEQITRTSNGYGGANMFGQVFIVPAIVYWIGKEEFDCQIIEAYYELTRPSLKTLIFSMEYEREFIKTILKYPCLNREDVQISKLSKKIV